MFSVGSMRISSALMIEGSHGPHMHCVPNGVMSPPEGMEELRLKTGVTGGTQSARSRCGQPS